MSDQTENAIKKAIISKFGKAGIEEETSVEFRGKVEIELNVVVSRGKDIQALPRVEVPSAMILGYLASKSGLEPHQVDEYILKASLEAALYKDKFVRYTDEAEKSLEKIRIAIQAKAEKDTKAAPTQVEGVVRITKKIPKK